MQLIEMTVSGGHVRMLYANAATKDEASEWLEFRVHSPARGNQRLGVIQQTALHRVRELVDAENERFAALTAQIRQ
jgi:hypothetical protein